MQSLKAKNINLIQRLNESNSKKAQRGSGKARLILPVVLLVLIVLGVMSYFWFKLLPEQAAAYLAAASYLSNEQNIADAEQAAQLTKLRDALAEEQQNLGRALAALDSYPDFDRALYNFLAQCIGSTPALIDNISYDQTSGVLAMSGVAPDAVKSADFAEKLRRADHFQAVAYYGYDGGEEGYNFTVQCLLKGTEEEAAL